MTRSYATTRYPSTSSSGGGFQLLTVSGTIDDSNESFTTTSPPSILVINGAGYEQTGGAITWTYSGGAITISVPVGTGGSIFGIASFSLIVINGTIDDSNTSFTSTSQPTLLCFNGGLYQPTGGAITWTYSGGNLTTSSPVGTGGSIFGIQ